jgi:FlaG/FlaF family flagellin (archaellin)
MFKKIILLIAVVPPLAAVAYSVVWGTRGSGLEIRK